MFVARPSFHSRIFRCRPDKSSRNSQVRSISARAWAWGWMTASDEQLLFGPDRVEDATRPQADVMRNEKRRRGFPGQLDLPRALSKGCARDVRGNCMVSKNSLETLGVRSDSLLFETAGGSRYARQGGKGYLGRIARGDCRAR